MIVRNYCNCCCSLTKTERVVKIAQSRYIEEIDILNVVKKLRIIYHTLEEKSIIDE